MRFWVVVGKFDFDIIVPCRYPCNVAAADASDYQKILDLLELLAQLSVTKAPRRLPQEVSCPSHLSRGFKL